MNPIRRKILCAVAAALWAASASSAMAQAFPSRPITIVVPYAPGGAPDTIARMLATSLTASLGQPVIVDNKSGAAGNIGAAFVAKAPPDGHTILFATQPIVTINPHLFKNMGFDPAKDLTPITAAVNVVMALSVNPSVPANNLTELMAYLRQNPGTSYGTSGIGSPMHLAGLRLATAAHADMTHVAYRGGALVLGDLIGNNIKLGFVDFASSKPFADSGKLRIIAIGEPSRFDGAAQIPTMSESVPGLGLTSWFGFFGPGGMPAALVERWNTELRKALLSPELKDKLHGMGIIVRPDGPSELARIVRSETESFGREVRENKITVE